MLNGTIPATSTFNSILGILGSSTFPAVAIGIAALVAGVATVGYAMEQYKNSITYKNQEIIKSIDEVKQKANEAAYEEVINIELSEQNAQRRVSVIDNLLQKYNEQKEAGEDTAETELAIQSAINDVNEDLDGSYYYWDSAKGYIYDVNGEVENLSTSLSNLATERAAQAVMEEWQEAYDEIIGKTKEMEGNQDELITQALEKWTELAEKAPTVYEALSKALDIGTDEALKPVNAIVQNMPASIQGIYSELLGMITELGTATSEIDTQKKEANQLKGSIDALNESEGEAKQLLVELAENNINITGNANEYLDGLNEQLDTLNTKREFLENLNLSTESIDAEIAEKEDLIKRVNDAFFGNEEEGTKGISTWGSEAEAQGEIVGQAVSETATGAEETIGQTIDNVEQKGEDANESYIADLESKNDRFYGAVFNPLNNAILEAAQVAEDWEIPDKTVTVHVNFDYGDYSTNGAMYGTYGGGSGGLTSGLMSGGVTLYNTINVSNNGKNITRTDVNGWGMQIADVVSEILGRRIGDV